MKFDSMLLVYPMNIDYQFSYLRSSEWIVYLIPAEVEYLETEEVYMQLNNSEVMDTEPVEDNEDHWEDSNIRLMLDLYLQNIERFRTPKIKKKNVWIDIGTAIGKGPDCCDKKFRNLKQTYIRLLKKRNGADTTPVKWPYFDIFEKIYSVNGEYQPEIAQKVQEVHTDTVAKALLAMAEPVTYETKCENIDSSPGQSEEKKRKITRKRNIDFRKLSLDVRNRQRVMEEKLDRLINIVEESNNIQRERNRLFQQFLDGINRNIWNMTYEILMNVKFIVLFSYQNLLNLIKLFIWDYEMVNFTVGINKKLPHTG